MYTDSVEGRQLARGGLLSFSIHLEYSAGTTMSKWGWSVWSPNNEQVSKGGTGWTEGELLDLLRDASTEACLAWDAAHTAWSHPRLFDTA